MDDKKYVCVRDYLNDGLLVGTLKTISTWKLWLLKTKIDDIYEVSLLYDENAIEQIEEILKLKENEVIRYISNNFDIKLVPLEDETKKYLIMDECKLVTEKELRKMLLEEETRDILNNSIDYIDRDLDLDAQLKSIKTALDGNIDDIIWACNTSWNIPVIKIDLGV